MATLEIHDLHVSVTDGAGEAREILRGVDLTVSAGQTHAIMGPNGSGKSTLAYAIAGHPKYLVTQGSITLDGEDVLAMSVDARARAGLFLAMQYPVEVPGVSVSNFLRTAITAVRGEAPKLRTFGKELQAAMESLSIDPEFARRNLNEGFSGGEKKRHEILQLELLAPKIAVLDETDSGLDIDALKVVAEGINRFRAAPDHGRHADHALHPDPALHHAGLRARVRRRADRRGGRPRARRDPRGRRLRAVGQGRGGLMTLDVARIRKDFPILERTVRGGQPLVYLDSANTSQKPRQVIDALTEFYERHNANIHRATHELGEEATEAYEGARIKAAQFIGAADETEVIFTKNISEGINLVAYSMGNASAGGSGPDRFRLGPGDEIVITEMEHHSNIVPWQLLCERTGATLRWFKVTGWDGQLDLSAADELINERTKLVALVHQSNVLGTINPVREIADAGPRGGRAGAGGRRPVGPAHAGRRGRRSAPTSWASPATRCAGRPASGCCGAAGNCSTRCRRSWVAGK